MATRKIFSYILNNFSCAVLNPCINSSSEIFSKILSNKKIGLKGISPLNENPRWPTDIPDHFKTQEMRDDAVRRRSWLLKHVPDWFVKEQHIGSWDDDELIKWYDDYKKRKA